MLFLRKLGAKQRFVKEDWFGDNDVKGDALKDVSTDNNAISVYRVESRDDPMIGRVVFALTLTRDSVADMDIVLLDEEVIRNCGIDAQKNSGSTPVLDVNEAHYDLGRFSGIKLV